jgi:Opioid growth factor receptor (OGFr) conserved region
LRLLRRTRSQSEGSLVAFYRGLAPAGCGATIDEILGWEDERLERVHDYIQWLFPLSSRSRAVPGAPVLDGEQIDTFRSSQELRSKLEAALDRMLSFYGLRRIDEESGPRVERSASFDERARTWLYPGSHNFLRLTRILTSLRLLGLPEHSDALFRALESIYLERPEASGATTFEFWKNSSRS